MFIYVSSNAGNGVECIKCRANRMNFKEGVDV